MVRTKLSVNQDWRFCRGMPKNNRVDEVTRADGKNPWEAGFDDTAWEVVHLPHTVRDEALMCSGGYNYQGIAWYRKHFFVSEEMAKSELLFELEGAMQRADIWLDGEPLGISEGGFLPMGFDLTGKLEPDVMHTLAIKLDNSDMPDVPPGKPQGALDFCYFGGLYRDAWLHARGSVRFSDALYEGKPASGGLFVTYPKVEKDAATVSVKAHVLNHSAKNAKLFVQILLDGEEVARSGAFAIPGGGDEVQIVAFDVSHPRLWHPRHPNLYRLTARLMDENGQLLDELTERIGIREIAFQPDGFYLNGEKLFLGGANRHQEYPYVGFALPDSMQRRDAYMMRKAGIICVRTAHYPQDVAFMDACDELGILCVIPTPGWQIHPSSVKFDLASYDNTRRMIRGNRNHPSAALWEPILNETDYPEYFAKKQLEIVREEMGDADAWCACDGHYAYADRYPVNYGFSEKSRLPIFIREYGDAYIEQFGPMSTLRRVRRGEHVSFYQGGEQAMIRSAQERFEAYYMMRSHGRLAGAAMWAGIDHNRGYEENEGAVGMWDFLRLPKYFYYLYDAQQEISEAGCKCFITNEWTAASPRDVQVYSNGEAVRLLLNGREIACLTAADGWANTDVWTKRVPGRMHGENIEVKNDEIPEGVHPPFTFRDVPFEPGELRAEALVSGEVAATYTVRTPGVKHALKLVPQYESVDAFVADGSDLLMVHVFIVDENGTVVPDADDEIRFSIEGQAKIVGDGETWVKANPVRAEAGASGVLLQAGRSAGEITLRAEAAGLIPAKIDLQTVKDEKAYVSGREEKQPSRMPIYAIDQNERFSERDSLKLYSFYRWDMASGKPATASSSMEGYPAENANQGRIGSPWIAKDGAFPQWWQCDMGEDTQIFGTSISWYDDGVWYDYDIEVSSDGNTWRQVSTGHASGQSHLPDRFSENVTTRYLRVVVRGVSGGQPAGMYLVEIHGEK